MGAGSSVSPSARKYETTAKEALKEFQRLEDENAQLKEEVAQLKLGNAGTPKAVKAQDTDILQGCSISPTLSVAPPERKTQPPPARQTVAPTNDPVPDASTNLRKSVSVGGKNNARSSLRLQRRASCKRPTEDVNLHPDTALYGGTAMSYLPFPTGAKPRVFAEIDLSALQENCKHLQRIAAKTGRKLLAILEANAYGHGAIQVAHTLYQCNGVDYFGVSTVNEGVELRMSRLPVEVKIVVWITHRSEWKLCCEYGLDVCIISEAMADEMIDWCEEQEGLGEMECAIRAHILINAGVSRYDPQGLGLALQDEEKGEDNEAQCQATANLISKIDEYNGIRFVGIRANLDPNNQSQLTSFRKMVDAVRAQGHDIEIIHLENSDTLCSEAIPAVFVIDLLRGRTGEYETEGTCVVGSALYGMKDYSYLQPCITMKAQIRHTHLCKKGCPVGYERAWTNPGDNIIATLVLGFADGYARAFSNTASYGYAGTVTINGHPFPIAGKVCMDMLMVNCGPPGGPADDVKVGDYGVLFGNGGVSLKDAAKLLQTTPSDVTCDFTRRVERRYIRPPLMMDGFFVCTSIEDHLHPEVLYGGHRVGALPFPKGCDQRVKLEVDLGAISENARNLQKLCERTGRKLLGILKANAYGMGAVVVAHMLRRCNKMDFFGVASINEAIELRMSGIPSSVHILVLGPTDRTEWRLFNNYDLDIGVQSKEAAFELIEWAYEQKRLGSLFRPMRVHVLLNTGMSRVGLQTFFHADDDGTDIPKWRGKVMETALIIKAVDEADKSAILFTACMTHMCDAHKGSPFTQTQFKRLKRAIDAARSLGVHIPMIHMENSEATLENLVTDEQVKEILYGPNGEYKSIGYCRSGGGMYGQRNYDIIKPACALKGQVRNVHVTPDHHVIATVATGYADGYSKEFANDASGKGGSVGIHGVLCPIASSIHMDALTVNCGSIDSPAGSKVRVGDYAVLFGPGGPALKEVAALLTTAQSDITCDLTRRPERFYINAPEPIDGFVCF